MQRLKVGQGGQRRAGTGRTGMQPNKGRAEENNETCKNLTEEKIDPKVSAEIREQEFCQKFFRTPYLSDGRIL